MKKLMIFAAVVTLFAACNAPSSQQAEKAPQVKAQPTKQSIQPAKTEVDPNGIQWLSMEEAQKMASKKPRKVLVDVYTPWCGPCKMMDRGTFKDPKVVQYLNENFYAVKFNAESGGDVQFKGQTFSNPQFDPNRPKNRRNAPHQLTRVLGVRGYPTLVVFDAEFNKKENIVGYRTPQQLLSALQQL